ncbi:V-type ATP synthase subunit F [Acetivibrio saccincola]|jgi:V/A-type H+-transporting ATPase subunit F|uniref:V-type ATP synthase subunit F n=1 Tax=Acetivibrio saccincola TaxID=1677857 RepID=A0A2K9DXD7_9FIRM|nr:V-type ATP synthase subunit F [Acetivibrio saccincola]AUG56227.1 V-type sodium ATPase subunit G [Acetivibrio saccincola]NLW26103.1 V-type ATP synthase subunit F [Acetivibrio saccincola]PQQ65587.1 V-type ATP synthase subunit F [Acetivibrio saccincola]HQD28114.1 V-type ATP synthase subunit F [Acetivibrio saccincola]
MYKIGVIGDKDSILGFKAVGISVFPVSTPEKAQEVLEKIADDQYAIVYITEQLAEKIVSTIDEYSERRFPAIIPIPSNAGSLGIGLQGIKKSVERAVGADILFKDE